MKKFVRISLLVIVTGLIGGWFYWQRNKKDFIKNQIGNAIAKSTDSLYFIHYDSSFIDEVNGTASFYNVTLQSDSLQRQLTLFDSTSSPNIYNVRIDEVSVAGANIAALISNSFIKASSIFIKHPVIYIIRSGKKEKKLLNSSDSLAIYEKLLGKFKSIDAGRIIIEDGQLNFTDKRGATLTVFSGIGMLLNRFRIDSTKNYQNMASYFVKDVVAKVKEVFVQGDNNQAIFSGAEYNAPARFISLKNFQQKNKEGRVVFDVSNTAIRNISTDAFIMQQKLKAEELASSGGILTFYAKARDKSDSTADEIEIDNNYFDEAQVNKISVGSTKIYIYKKTKPGKPPLVINNVKFNAADIQKLHSGTNIKNLISSSNWQLSADGFSFVTQNNRYKINVGAFDMNNASAIMRIKAVTVKLLLSEAAFSRGLAQQEDLYNLEFNNIELGGIDTRMLLTKQRLAAATASLQPVIKIYRDKTVAEDKTSKLGKYPHQILKKTGFSFSIKKINLKSGLVAYTEKARQSEKTGTVFFNNINATLTNVTNDKEAIKRNSMLLVNAAASFMGVSDVQTNWKFPLSSSNGAFEVSGSAAGFNAVALNSVIEPLGMASIQKGQVNRLSFNIAGTDIGTTGNATLLYNDLKMELLMKDSGQIKKNALQTMLVNALMRSSNPVNGITRTEGINYQRDMNKSFFSLVWKSIYSAIKKTTQKANP